MKEFFSALFHLDFNKLFRDKTTNSFIQFFRYIFVGGFAFIVDAAALWACEKFAHYMLAAAIAFVAGLAANYALSVLFVFSESKQVENKFKEFFVYAVIGLIGLALTEAIMYILTDICSFYFMLSKVFAAAVVLVWNFAARKVILYSNKGEQK